MTPMQQLVNDAQISAAVVGKGEQYILIPLDQDGAPLSDALLCEAHAKQYEFCGVFGLINGIARSKSVSADSLPTMCAAIPAFVEHVRERLTPKGDSVDWLEHLYQLPDTRTN